jgi:protocatechuate 3,4-dioxygenase beta subunit
MCLPSPAEVMKLPSHVIMFSLLLLCAGSLSDRAYSQTKPESKVAEATVSGKVTIKGKPAAGIVVGMRLSRPDQFSSTYKAKTDQEGVYRISKVAGGSYFVAPVAPTFVIAGSGNDSFGQSVIITESENVEGIDFDLVPGGVITGKVVDSEGRPLIEEYVTAIPADEGGSRRSFMSPISTDDRGVYRIFGLASGRYKISVGDPRFGRGDRRRIAAQTFYPDVTDAAKAGIVEVKEGSEANKIDITIGEAPQGYTVTGRVIDGESGNPVAGAFIQLMRIEVIDSNSTHSFGENLNVRTDAQGQFRISNVRPGKYDVFASAPEESNIRAEAPVRFDMIDQDVSGLVIKTSTSGATVEGTIVFEGSKNNPAPAPGQFYIMIYTRSEGSSVGSGISSSRSVHPRPDGTFFAGAVPAGLANFNVEIPNNKGFNLTRVERDGVVVTNGIPVQKGEHISGLRLVMTFSSGIIRGAVRVENGTLPSNARIIIQVMKVGDQTPLPRGAEVDSRGHFLLEGLPPGSYEVRALAYGADWQRRRPPMSVKQIVIVTEGAAADVTVILDLTATPNQ